MSVWMYSLFNGDCDGSILLFKTKAAAEAWQAHMATQDEWHAKRGRVREIHVESHPLSPEPRERRDG